MFVNSAKLSSVAIAWLYLFQQVQALPVPQASDAAKTSKDKKTVYPVVHNNPLTPWVDDLHITVTAYVEGPEDFCRNSLSTTSSSGSSDSISSTSSSSKSPFSTASATGPYPVVNVDGSSDGTVTITINPDLSSQYTQVPESRTVVASTHSSAKSLVSVPTETSIDNYYSVDVLPTVIESSFYSTTPTTSFETTKSSKIVPATTKSKCTSSTSSEISVFKDGEITSSPAKTTTSATFGIEEERFTTVTEFDSINDMFITQIYRVKNQSSSLLEASTTPATTLTVATSSATSSATLSVAISSAATSSAATSSATSSAAAPAASSSEDVTTVILNDVVITRTVPGQTFDFKTTTIPEVTSVMVKTLLKTTFIDGKTVLQTFLVEKDQTTTLVLTAVDPTPTSSTTTSAPTTTTISAKTDYKTLTQTLTVDGVEVTQTVIIDVESTITGTPQAAPTNTAVDTKTDYMTLTQTLTIDGVEVTQTVIVDVEPTIVGTLKADPTTVFGEIPSGASSTAFPSTDYQTITQTLTVEGELITQTVVVDAESTVIKTLEASTTATTSSEPDVTTALSTSPPDFTSSSSTFFSGLSTVEFVWRSAFRASNAVQTFVTPSSTIQPSTISSSPITLAWSALPNSPFATGASNDLAADVDLSTSAIFSDKKAEVTASATSAVISIQPGLDVIAVQTLAGEKQPPSDSAASSTVQQNQAGLILSDSNYDFIAEMLTIKPTTTTLVYKGTNGAVSTTIVRFPSSTKKPSVTITTPSVASLGLRDSFSPTATSTIEQKSSIRKKSIITVTTSIFSSRSSFTALTPGSTVIDSISSSTLSTSPHIYTDLNTGKTSSSSTVSTPLPTSKPLILSTSKAISSVISAPVSLSISVSALPTAITTTSTSISTPSSFVTSTSKAVVTSFSQSLGNYKSSFFISSSASAKSRSSLSFGHFYNATTTAR